ncbi:MAG: pirin family protein [Hymenobacteraceae bacterium]|nr:pirin family protein [Hymenobacteraceae bacterium]
MALRTPTVTVRSAPLTGDAHGYYYTQPLPAPELPRLDPFLLLHHHGPMTLPPGSGMPFGPHPHRGFCTLTVILAGSVVHQDSHGFRSQVDGTPAAAGAQWMTAGRGLIHNESTPKEFADTGGPLELLQLWINLPARLKLTPAHYESLAAGQVLVRPLPGAAPGAGMAAVGATTLLFTGVRPGLPPSYTTPTGTVSALVRLPVGTSALVPAPAAQAVLLYVLRGRPTLAGTEAKPRVCAAFAATAATAEIAVAAGAEEALLFYCAAEPLREPVVQHGPFVMTTEKEILEAMRDYQMGRMGVFIDE